jgi:hypothetical protein
MGEGEESVPASIFSFSLSKNFIQHSKFKIQHPKFLFPYPYILTGRQTPKIR